MAISYYRLRDGYARTVVVGDVHGCHEEILGLLELVGFDRQRDAIVGTGDLVDRGPGSWDVCRSFRDMENAFTVLGNHERRLAGTIRGTSKPAWSQRHSLTKLDPDEWTSWAMFFEGLAAVIESDHAIITHARLDPNLSLQNQEPDHTCAVGGNRVRIELDQQGVPRWFNEMSFAKPVCIGHVGYQRVELVASRLYGLDTGAVRGGPLTCVVLPACQVFSVEAKRDYYGESYREWHVEQTLTLGDPENWPLSKVIELLGKQPLYDSLSATALRIRAQGLIGMLRIQQWALETQAALCKKFGDVPPDQRRACDTVICG